MSNKDIDWSDLYKTGSVGQDPSVESIIKSILSQPKWRQPTNKEIEKIIKAMYPNLVTTKEEEEALEKAYQNVINNWYIEAKKPIDNKPTDWANGKSFNDSLSEEEIKARDLYIEGE